MSDLIATEFKVLNYRNIEDSGWIPIENVTAIVGRNESGKTSLLKALHKFNPATAEPYIPVKKFPRDRFTKDFKNGADWPVCKVKFSIKGGLQETINKLCEPNTAPEIAVCTRYYDGKLAVDFEPKIIDPELVTNSIISILEEIIKDARRLNAPTEEDQERTQTLRQGIIDWATKKKDSVNKDVSLRTEKGRAYLTEVRDQLNTHSDPITADVIEKSLEDLEKLIEEANKETVLQQSCDLVADRLPAFIYFENYGILDSAVYLPRFLEDLNKNPHDPKIRTINSMFKHVQLTAKNIAELGNQSTAQALFEGKAASPKQIANDLEKLELRSVKLNSASLDITRKFSDWWQQRRHTIRYHADGSFFRIWISDDRRPNVEIELESRSKGFQWFFSFYLVFLVESEEGHKDSIILLDEPSLHLHPTAQQELIGFVKPPCYGPLARRVSGTGGLMLRA